VRLPQLGMAILFALGVPAGISPGRSPSETAVFAGGCYWGVEAVFEHLRGVDSVAAGYARGAAGEPGRPVEAVQVVYRPDEISYQELLEVFFQIAHDPTSRDRQGPDAGPEYRAVVFSRDAEQRRLAVAFVAALSREHRFAGAIVTEIQPFGRFERVGASEQNYAARHPDDPYIRHNDAPKLERLRRAFPKLYREPSAD